MAYDPTIPALNNYIGDDIPKIMANFAQLAGSRIVDHNLDVSNPPNGWYVRWDNGLQICFHRIIVGLMSGAQYTTRDFTWTFPAAFLSGEMPYVVASASYPGGDLDLVSGFLIGIIITSPSSPISVKGYIQKVAPVGSITPWATLLAVGRWK